METSKSLKMLHPDLHLDLEITEMHDLQRIFLLFGENKDTEGIEACETCGAGTLK